MKSVTSTVLMGLLLAAAHAAPQEPLAPYLAWSTGQAEDTIKKMLVKGRVPGTRRMLNTEQAQSYKLRALWFTPEVIGASARQIQLQDRLTEAQARALVEEAETPGYTVILVDLDPDEGSGVIPPDWAAFLGPRSAGADAGRWVRGLDKPGLVEKRALAGALRRNYDYDRFWVKFPLQTDAGAPLFSPADAEVELTVRIRGREERVRWPIPESIRKKMSAAVADPAQN